VQARSQFRNAASGSAELASILFQDFRGFSSRNPQLCQQAHAHGARVAFICSLSAVARVALSRGRELTELSVQSRVIPKGDTV